MGRVEIGRDLGIVLFENVRCVALDINGTLIDGSYRSWEWIFEEGLRLRKRENAQPLRWYDVQTGKLPFEVAVASTYVAEHPETMREEAFRVYMAKLKLRKDCVELLEALRSRYQLVVCSDTSGVTKLIAKTFDLQRYFTGFFYSIDIGWMKSDREFWTTFLTAFPGKKPSEFVMVGDNTRCDIHWPNVLGIGTIQIESTEVLPRRSLEVLDEFDRPNIYVRSLGEVSKILLK